MIKHTASPASHQRPWIGILFCGLIFGTGAQASAIYTYEGEPFTSNFVAGATLVSGSLTFANPLPTLLSKADVTSLVIGWSFSDGADNFDATNSTLYAYFSTDTEGAISSFWEVTARFNNPSPYEVIGLDTVNGALVFDDGVRQSIRGIGSSGNSYMPGTWSSSAVAPEIDTSVMLGIALLPLIYQRRKQ